MRKLEKQFKERKVQQKYSVEEMVDGSKATYTLPFGLPRFPFYPLLLIHSIKFVVEE